MTRAWPVQALAPLAVVALLATACVTPSYSAEGGVKAEPAERLLGITAEARGQERGEPVATRVISRGDAAGILRAAADAEVGPAAREASDEAVGTLGLWPPEEKASEAATALTSEQILGFYVPRERTLYLIHDAEIPGDVRVLSAFAGQDLFGELVLSHELAHALQHRAEPSLFDRAAFFHAHSDAATALAAAAEGDATRASFLAVGMPQLPQGPDFEAATREEIEGDESLRGAPALLRLDLSFAYGRGYTLAVQEGPPLVSEPPVSTEQGLHDERRREAFTALDLRTTPAPQGCTLVHEDEVGELGIRALFEDHGPETPPSAWEGWDGDRYRTYRCGDGRAFAWLTLWDSETDAAEFAAAYERIAPSVARRARLGGAPQAARHGREVWVASPDRMPAAAALAGAARRGRVATLDELFAFHGEPPRRPPAP